MNGPDESEPLSQTDRDAADWLARIRGGGRTEQAAFEQWYSADPSHADAYDRVLASWEAMGRLRDPAEPAAPGRRYSAYAVAAAAAALLAIVGIGTLYRPHLPNGASSEGWTTRVGEVRTVALSDGSKVTLDTATAIRADIGPARRQVRLIRGRAQFAVAGDTRPFVVDTDTASVTTADSTLDVTYLDGGTTVGVLNGTADLRPSMQPATAFRVASGQAASIGRAGRTGATTRFTPSDAHWTAGMLSFENAPLSAVVAAANRYSARPIVLDGAAVGQLQFTGSFKPRDTAAVGRMLAAMFGLKHDETDPARVTLSRP